MASTEAKPRRLEVWLVSLGAAGRREPRNNRPPIMVSADQLSTGTAAGTGPPQSKQ